MRFPRPLIGLLSSIALVASLMGCGGGGGGGTGVNPTPTPTVTISPANPSLPAGTTMTLSASIANGVNSHGFYWSLSGSGNGFITPIGNPLGTQATYMAPLNTGSATITATSVDYAVSSQVVVTITPVPTVAAARYPSNQTYSFYPYSAAPSEGFWFNAGDLTSGVTSYFAKLDSTGTFSWAPMPQIPGFAQTQRPMAMAAGGPNNRLYILSGGNGGAPQVLRVNPASGTVEATVPTSTHNFELNFGLGVDQSGTIWANDVLADGTPVFVRIPSGGGAPATFSIPATPMFLSNPIVDASGSWWLDIANGGRLLHVETSGVVTPFSGPIGVTSIGPATGANGSLWFGNTDSLVQFIPGTGFKPSITTGSSLYQPFEPTALLGATSDGRFWFGCKNNSDGSPYLGVINSDGTQAYYRFALNPVGVAVSLDRGSIGADGKFYFLDKKNKAVLVLTHP